MNIVHLQADAIEEEEYKYQMIGEPEFTASFFSRVMAGRDGLSLVRSERSAE